MTTTTARARSLRTRGLLAARARAHRGLLASATATVTVAVATVCALVEWLAIEVERAGAAAPPRIPPEEVAAQIDRGIIALVSAAPGLVLVIVIIGATASAQLARLISAARENESATLRTRGLSRRQALGTNTLEYMVAMLVGAVLGLAVADLALSVTGVAGWSVTLSSQWWVAAVTSVALGLVLVLASRPHVARSVRGARATTATTVVLLLLAAAFVLWQLRRAQPTGFDPVVAVGPSVMLMAGALLVPAVFGATATAWTLPAASFTGLAPSYPARQVARGLRFSAVAVLLVGLTVTQAVFASAYSSTSTAMVTDSAALRAGADLRVDLHPSAATPALVAETAAVQGVESAAPALSISIEIGSTNAQLVSVPTSAITTILTGAGGVVDRAALEAAVQPADGSVAAEPVALGAEATGLRLTATIDSSRPAVAATVAMLAVVTDATGASAQLRLAGELTDQPDGTASVIAEAPLPDGTGPWQALAVVAAVPPSYANAPVVVQIDSAEAIGASPLDITGAVTLDQGAGEQVVWLADASTATNGPAPVRAVLSSALATRLGLVEGDGFEFRYEGTGRRGRFLVAAVVDTLPGVATELAVFAPLEVLEISMLQRGTSIVPSQSVWVSGSTSADVALSAALDDRPVLTAAPGITANVVGGLVTGWWIATAGSAVLALIAALAIVQTLALARRRELGVLRALGVAPGLQARMHAGELSAVFGASVVLGAAAGALVAWLTIPDLVRAVTPDTLALGTPVTLAWPELATAIAALTAGLAVIVFSATVSVRRMAAKATVVEQTR